MSLAKDARHGVRVVCGGVGLQQVPFGFAQGRLSPGFPPDSE
jgi:hypothetical protein